MERTFVLLMGIYICKLFSLNSKSKSGLEKMKTIQISPVITSREIVQLTGEQKVFIVLSYTRTLSTTEVRNAFQKVSRSQSTCTN